MKRYMKGKLPVLVLDGVTIEGETVEVLGVGITK